MPEGAKLIYIRKDMKLPVGKKIINLEGRRREQGVGVKFEGTVRGNVWETDCHDDWDFGGTDRSNENATAGSQDVCKCLTLAGTAV